MNDVLLLRAYVKDGSQRAFADLVQRYTPLVYSAAMRQMRDASAAEDVAQAVFVCLAKNARRIREGSVLSAWLMTTTRYYCANARKMDARRRRHEEQAAREGRQAQRPPPDPANAWERVSPSLDGALAKLGERLRAALLLRYFEGMSVKEVAGRLGVSEAAAKQRLSRGVDQLRAQLVRDGHASLTSFDLAALLAAHAISAAPPGLAPAIAAAAAHAAATAAAAVGGGKGVVTIMATAKAKITAAILAAALLTGGGAVVAHQYLVGDTRVVPLSAPSPAAPAAAAVTRETVTYSGTVVGADGKPVEGVEVLLASFQHPVSAYAGVTFGGKGAPSVRTASDGSFSFPPGSPCQSVVARSAAAGFALVDPSQLTLHHRIVLAPWARLEVTVKSGDAPLKHAGVHVNGASEDYSRYAVFLQTDGRTDDSGRVVFERIVPGLTQASRELPGPTGRELLLTHTTSVPLSPGQAAQLTIGGTGRPLTGRVVADGHAELPTFIGTISLVTENAFGAADRGRASSGIPYSFGFWTAPDGSFRVEDVPAGRYRLRVEANSNDPASRFPEIVAEGETDFTVPPMPGDRSREPQAIGPVRANFRRRFKPGDEAPEIAALRPTGEAVRIANYRGKYLLLYAPRPRANSNSWIAHDLPAVWDEYADDGRFAMIDVWAGAGAPPAPPGPAPWPHAHLAQPFQQPLPREYNAEMPLFLIGPDGKLIAKNLDARGALSLLGRYLGGRSSGVAPVVITAEHHALDVAGPAFAFSTVPPLSADNAARQAVFTVVDGGPPPDRTGGLRALHDGVGPANADQPSANFFFESGILEGRIKVDLGRPIPLSQVNTYSWHKSTRCPQLYKVYCSDGTSRDFDPAPKNGVDPSRHGWSLLATVDTRPRDRQMGGQDAVGISLPPGVLAPCRYLLFVTFPTETEDPFGNTFFSEITISERK